MREWLKYGVAFYAQRSCCASLLCNADRQRSSYAGIQRGTIQWTDRVAYPSLCGCISTPHSAIKYQDCEQKSSKKLSSSNSISLAKKRQNCFQAHVKNKLIMHTIKILAIFSFLALAGSCAPLASQGKTCISHAPCF
jgi:hypothetical protein